MLRELLDIGHALMNDDMRSSRTTTVGILVFTTFGCVGCPKSQSTTQKAARPSLSSAPMHAIGDVQYDPPAGWTVESAMGGTLLLAPTVEENWQANIFLETRHDTENRTPDDQITDYIETLKTTKAQFKEVRRSIQTNAHGLQYALVEYTSDNTDTPLTNRELIIQLSGDKRLFVTASSASSLWDKYRPDFEAMIESLKLTSRP